MLGPLLLSKYCFYILKCAHLRSKLDTIIQTAKAAICVYDIYTLYSRILIKIDENIVENCEVSKQISIAILANIAYV